MTRSMMPNNSTIPVVRFEAVIEPLVWGRNTYTILRLPDEIVVTLGRPTRVEGEISEHPVNMGLARADVIEGAFLYTGKDFLVAAGIEPGDVVEVRLSPADPDHVEMPDGLLTALRAARLTPAWEKLTPGRRRGLVQPISKASVQRHATGESRRWLHRYRPERKGSGSSPVSQRNTI